MKLIVVSDTHYYNNCLFELQKQYPQADYFIHCGDLEGDPDQYPGWIIVRGNNDYDLRLPLNKILEIENHRILIMHSHNMRMCRTEAMVHDALVNNCDIVCFGHTHVPSKQKENNVLLINPGSIWFDRSGKKGSYAIIDINSNDVCVEFVYNDGTHPWFDREF